MNNSIEVDGVIYGPAQIRHMRERLRGFSAAQKVISDFINESRDALRPYGKRQGYKIDWWKGRFQGLVSAKAMMVLGDFPNSEGNRESIEKILK